MKSQRIVWFSWKDRHHPLAGGAEVVTDELCARMAADGHNVTLLCAGYSGALPEETMRGYRVIRRGGRYSVYLAAAVYFLRNLRKHTDLVVEEINTVPFMTQWYTKRSRRWLFIHQLCREIWFYQMPPVLSHIGYVLEPVYLKMLSRNRVLTVSGSTRSDLMRYGFSTKNIEVISEGIELDLISSLTAVKKFDRPTVLSLGAIRAMKRPDHQLKAFEILKQQVPTTITRSSVCAGH
jgi:glycosyltransferase involved in cell wall biosynthesis